MVVSLLYLLELDTGSWTQLDGDPMGSVPVYASLAGTISKGCVCVECASDCIRETGRSFLGHQSLAIARRSGEPGEFLGEPAEQVAFEVWRWALCRQGCYFNGRCRLALWDKVFVPATEERSVGLLSRRAFIIASPLCLCLRHS